VEGRVAGANQADTELAKLHDADVPASVVVSTSALQAGILSNLEAARLLLSSYSWDTLRGLRQEALRHGLQGAYGGLRADALCEALVELAHDGLKQSERWMLAYPRHVLRTGKNGAVRAVEAYERMTGDGRERLLRLVRNRALVLVSR